MSAAFTFTATLDGLEAALGQAYTFDVRTHAGGTERLTLAEWRGILVVTLDDDQRAIASLEAQLQAETKRGDEAVANLTELLRTGAHVEDVLRERALLESTNQRHLAEIGQLRDENRGLREQFHDQAKVQEEIAQLRAAIKAQRRVDDLRAEIAAGVRDAGAFVVRTFVRNEANGLVQMEIVERL